MKYHKHHVYELLILTLAIGLPQVMSFLASIYAVTLMNATNLSLYGTLMAVVGVGTTVAIASQSTSAKLIGLGSRSIMPILKLSLAITTLSCIFAIPFMKYGLNLSTLQQVGVYVLLLNLSYVSCLEGYYLGKKQSDNFAAIVFLANMIRIGASLIGILILHSANAALLGLCIGGVISSVGISTKIVKDKEFNFQALTPTKLGIQSEFLIQLVSMASMYLFIAGDVLAARWFLPVEDSATYVAGNLISKIVLFSSSPILFFAFPKFQLSNRLKFLKAATLLTICISGCGLLLAVIYPQLIVKFIPELQNLGISHLFAKFALLGLVLGISQLWLYYNIIVGINLTWVPFLTGFLVLFAYGYSGAYKTIDSVLNAMLICAIIVVFGMISLMILHTNRSTEKDSGC